MTDKENLFLWFVKSVIWYNKFRANRFYRLGAFRKLRKSNWCWRMCRSGYWFNSDSFIRKWRKITNAEEAFKENQFSDSIYYAYTAFVNTAKALLISEDVNTNTQAGIITSFQEHFVASKIVKLESSFEDLVYQMKHENPTKAFAQKYLKDAKLFYQKIDAHRKTTLSHA